MKDLDSSPQFGTQLKDLYQNNVCVKRLFKWCRGLEKVVVERRKWNSILTSYLIVAEAEEDHGEY